MKENEDKLVLLDTFDNRIDAEMARQYLEADGIPCMLTNENMASLYPVQGIGNVELRVFAYQLEDARRMMDDFKPGELSD